MRKYATYVFQEQGDFHEMDKEDRNYREHGGGLRPPIMATRMEVCAECGSSLGRPCVKSALVYGFHVSRDVRQSNRRCNNRACASIYWRNYRYIRRRKVFSQEAGRAEVVSAYSNVGFGMEFIRCVRELHFRGFLSFSALVKSHAAIFKSPTTRRFKKLRPDAFCLVREVREYGSVGIDVGRIVIGERQIRRTTPNLASTS